MEVRRETGKEKRFTCHRLSWSRRVEEGRLVVEEREGGLGGLASGTEPIGVGDCGGVGTREKN